MTIKNVVLILMILSIQSVVTQPIQRYKIELKLNPQSLYTNLICNTEGKKLNFLDTCIVDTSRSSCIFTLDAKKYTKGIYALIKLNKNKDRRKDFYFNAVLDTDSNIVMSINDSLEVSILESKDNLILYQFLKVTAPIYEAMKNLEKDTSLSQRDSAKIYTQKLKEVFNLFQKQYPNHTVDLIIQLQELAAQIIDIKATKTQKDSLRQVQSMRALFWNKMPLQDERIVSIPNYYDLLEYVSRTYVGTNIDSIKINFINKLLSQSNVKNKSVAFNYLATKYGLSGKLPFQRADELLLYMYDSLLVKKLEDYKGVNLYMSTQIYPFKKLKNGMQAPEFEAIDTTKKIVKLKDVKSKYVVIAFWDPNCYHCKVGIPLLDSMVNQTALQNKQIQVIGIKTDGTRADWINFIQEKKIKKWIHLEETRELRKELAQRGLVSSMMSYNINQTPLFFLLDENKKIIAKHFLPTELGNFIK